MAPRKNAKGGGGGNSSSSSSGSGGSSSGSSSSSGARRDTKHGGQKNGRKGALSGSSFFTWFMVIALLGVWTSVAVVWFELVDYEEVLGKLGVYDADGDGDFDVDDAKVLLGEDLQPEEDGPAEQQPDEDDFLVGSDAEDRIEPLETGTFQEETEDSYHVEETASQASDQDVEEMMYEQENPDSTEPVIDDDERMYHDADDVTYQDYDQQVYEPSEGEGVESSDTGVEESNVILEVPVPPAEEQQEIPPETNRKTDDPEQKEKVKKKKPKLLNKFDKTIKAELDAAEKLRKRGKIEEAVTAFEELIRKYPQSPRARYGKAQVL
uniref:Aspartate beta-hydroxylase n=1 Tax=Molossus molossus TaxID=27622 RepID=A0A7J8DST0_MOLMO|nr:aspartate beta-hydroxylase [Molossus molossus]